MTIGALANAPNKGRLQAPLESAACKRRQLIIDIDIDIDNDNDNDSDNDDIDIDVNMKEFLMIPRLTNEQMNEEAGCGVRDIMIGSQSLKTIRNNCI